MTTEADKVYMMAGAIPPSHLAEIQKNGTPYKGQTRRDLVAENKRLRDELKSGNGATSTKLTHRQTVAAKKRESLTALLDQVEARRKKRELKNAEDTGRRLAFCREIGANKPTRKARVKAPSKPATVTKSKSVYARYLEMKSGPERKAYLKANHAAIMHAVNTKEGNQ